jgi:predicted negative regulator of RcsB-dependent stress response
MTRHQLKEQDEITTSLQKATEFLYAHQKQFITGAVVVVVLFVAIFGYSFYRSSRNASAQEQLSVAINAFNDTTKPEKERYEKTIAEAQKTYDAYSSLPVGHIARYYIGMSQEGLGDTAKAVETLQQVIQQADDDIKGIAQFSLAGIHAKHGETQKAIDVQKQLYDSGGYSKAAVGYELATLYEANKQVDQAKELYQKIVTDFPDSPFRQSADEALKRLGVVTPPPKPS